VGFNLARTCNFGNENREVNQNDESKEIMFFERRQEGEGKIQNEKNIQEKERVQENKKNTVLNTQSKNTNPSSAVKKRDKKKENKEMVSSAENIFNNYLLAFGGPDGVLIPYDRFRRTTLEDSILKDIFLKLLEKYKVVIISNQRYYDDPRTKELGLQSRLINYIPPHLRKNLTLYTSAGTFKIGFDEEGREIPDESYNKNTYIEPEYVEIILSVLNEVKNNWWREYENNPSLWRNKYPIFNFREPEIILHKDKEDHIHAITLLYLPSKRLEAHNLEKGEKDVREALYKEIKQKIENRHPSFWNEFEVRTSGLTSIDIRKKHRTGKRYALENYLFENKIHPENTLVFGNLDYYSEDISFKEIKGIYRFSNTPHIQQKGFRYIGSGLGSIYYFMEGLLNNQDLNTLLAQKYTNLEAALSYLRKEKQSPKYNSLTYPEKLSLLFEIYHKFNLTYTDTASWTELFIEAMDIKAQLRSALEEVKDSYSNYKKIKDYFANIDNIFNKYKNLDFIEFYSAIDPRCARTLTELLKIYINRLGKTKDDFIKDIKNEVQSLNLPISYILAGYFQDSYYLRYKESILKEKQARSPPEVVYLGGGGKATTTFLMTLLAKTLYRIACIISGSDDGGSSWKIMEALFNKLGFYFIPPGDAAGLAIFLSNDSFKIFTFFWSESEEKKLADYMITRGRITADSLYPIWIKRIEEVLYLTEYKTKEIENILPLLDTQRLKKPHDLILFLSSIITLGELLDRELISKGIIELDKTSSPNLLLIGAAYDLEIIGKKGVLPLEFTSIDKLLNLERAQFIPVTYDYERSALVGKYESDKYIYSQTLITDKGHEEFLKELFFAHRIGTGYTQKDFIIHPDVKAKFYPEPTKQAIEALRKAKVIIMGNGSLWTSLIPVLLYPEVAQILIKKVKEGIPVIYIAKIKADLETSYGVGVIEKDNKYYLKIEEQLSLGEQLEAIRKHVERVLKEKGIIPQGKQLQLNEIITHVIVPQIDEKTREELEEVELSEEDAKKLKKVLEKGEPQISKYIKGVQPLFTGDEEQQIKNQGIKIIKAKINDLEGIKDKKPVYRNEFLVEVIKKIMDGGERKAKLNILCVCNYNYNRSPAMEMVFDYFIKKEKLENYIEVNSGGAQEENKNGWGATNQALTEAFSEIFNAKPKKIISKSLSIEQVRNADIIVVANEEVLNRK